MRSLGLTRRLSTELRLREHPLPDSNPPTPEDQRNPLVFNFLRNKLGGGRCLISPPRKGFFSMAVLGEGWGLTFLF